MCVTVLNCRHPCAPAQGFWAVPVGPGLGLPQPVPTWPTVPQLKPSLFLVTQYHLMKQWLDCTSRDNVCILIEQNAKWWNRTTGSPLFL